MNIKILQGPMGSGKSLFIHKYIYINKINKENVYIFKEKENFIESTRAGVDIEGNYIILNDYKDIFSKTKDLIRSFNNFDNYLIIFIDSILIDLEINLTDVVNFFDENAKFFMKNVDLFIPSNPIYYNNTINLTNSFLTKKFDTFNFECYCYYKKCINLGFPKNIKQQENKKDTEKNNYLTLCQTHSYSNLQFHMLKTSQIAWMNHVYFYPFKNLQNLKSNICIKGFYSMIFYNILLHCTSKKIKFSEIEKNKPFCNKYVTSFDFNSFIETKILDNDQDKNCDKCSTIWSLCKDRNYDHIHLDLGYDNWVGIDSINDRFFSTDKLILIQ